MSRQRPVYRLPEGGADEILRVRVPDVDTIIFSSGIASAERRRIFKRGADFQVEGSTPVFVIPDFRVEPEGAVGKGSGYARLFKTDDGALAVRFDVRFRMRAALIMPYSDDEQAWAIFRKKEPNQTVETTRLLAPRFRPSGLRSTRRFHSKKTSDRAPRVSHL